MTLTHTRLLDVLSYDPVSGHFYWKVCRRKELVGRRAGRVLPDGHRQIGVDGRKYYAHRLAWFYVMAEWPSGDVDHRDLRKDNNAFSNLRQASRSQNLANTGPGKRNASGVKGVSFVRARGRWQASICVKGRSFFLGQFATRDEAASAYATAANDMFGEFARPTLSKAIK